LLQAKHKGFYYKIPDVGLAQKPFDAVIVKDKAHVAICFWEARVKKICYFVDIDMYMHAKTKAIKKSMREAQVREIKEFEVDLLKDSTDLTLKAAESNAVLYNV
jgi:translation initiation factor IF-3